MKTILTLFLSLTMANHSFALFGFGKKKTARDEEKAKTQQLPGMESTPDESPRAAPLPDAPRMSEDTATPVRQATAVVPNTPATPPIERSAPPAASGTPVGGQMPTEVIIQGKDAGKLSTSKPPLRMDADPFESIRDSLKPDESLLLAESPLTITWRRTHPEFLANERVIQPWRTTFSDRAGIAFDPRSQLYEAIGRQLDQKEAKGFQWAITIADEEGRVFQHYEGSSNPPDELVWSGQNDQGEWIKAGRSYSPIYMFTDPGGSPHTKTGKILQFKGVVHQEPSGLHVSLDSSVLFGPMKGLRTVDPKAGLGLARAAADFIKRKFGGVPIRIDAYAGNKELADAQAQAVQAAMMSELMLTPQYVSVAGGQAGFADQRVDIVLLNR